MQRFKFIGLMVMSGLLLFLSGCQKEEVSTVYSNEEYITSARTLNNTENNTSAITRPLHKEHPNLEFIPAEYWDIEDAGIAAMKYDEIYTKVSNLSIYGTPIWAASISVKTQNKTLIAIPLIDDENIVKTMYIVERENSDIVRFLFLSRSNNPFTNSKDTTDYFAEMDVLMDKNNNGNQKCPNFGCKKGFFKKFFGWMFGWVPGLFSGSGGNVGDASGFPNIPWIQLDETSGGGSGGGTFGGGSGNNPNNYTNPRGGTGNSDIRLKTVEGCKEYIMKSWGMNINPENFQEKIDRCGCTRAAFVDNFFWNLPTTTGKMQCLACYVGAFSGQSLNQLVNIFMNISFPCQNVSPSTVNTMIDDALGDVCYRNFYNLPIYPGLILHNFTTQLNALNLTYFATTWQNTLAVASMDIVQMGVVLDYTQKQVAVMSPTEICNGVKIAECLKSGILHGNNYVFQDNKEVLDFYKYSNLINPCTGAQIDKDGILLKLCEQGKVSMSSINDALEGVDYIDDFEISGKNCPCVYAIWKQLKNKIVIDTMTISENVCIKEILSDFLVGPLQAELGITKNSIGTTNAITIPNTTYGPNQLYSNTRIEINKDLCGNSISKEALEIAGMFLHEFVHARIFEHLYRLGYSTSFGVQSDKWEKFVQSHYPGLPITETQHQIMAQAYVNDIAAALYELNGGIGNPSDYLIFAWQGLSDAFTDEQKEKFSFLPDLELLRNNYNQNAKGKGTLSYNNCN